MANNGKLTPVVTARRLRDCCCAVRRCRLGRCCALLFLLWIILCDPTRARADTFRLLPSDRDALQARVDMIQQARYQIDCACYMTDTGRVPAALMRLLVDAASRGVRVRLLVDGLMTRLPIGLHETLTAAGVELHVYRPPTNLCPWALNQRMHDKLLIVDGRQLVMGSRNLQDSHFGLREPRFIDCDVYIEGPTAAWAGAYYEWLWNHKQVMPIAAVNTVGKSVLKVLPPAEDAWAPAWRAARCQADFFRLLDASLAALVANGSIALQTGNCWSDGCHPHVDLEFVHEADTSKADRSLQKRLLDLIHNARQSLLIQTPYPVFTELDLETIFSARARGIRVVICTNSLHSSDRLSTYAAFENIKDILLSAGVEIYEMPGPNHLHNKAMIIDDTIAVVGSYNFDERSAHLNLEVSVIAYDGQAAMQLRRVIEAQMEGAYRVAVAPRVFDARPCGASKARTLKMHFGRLLVPTFRGLL